MSTERKTDDNGDVHKDLGDGNKKETVDGGQNNPVPEINDKQHESGNNDDSPLLTDDVQGEDGIKENPNVGDESVGNIEVDGEIDDEDNGSHPETPRYSYHDSDSDIIDYDYDPDKVIPDFSDSDADSWDWTFRDERINDLEVKPPRRTKKPLTLPHDTNHSQSGKPDDSTHKKSGDSTDKTSEDPAHKNSGDSTHKKSDHSAYKTSEVTSSKTNDIRSHNDGSLQKKDDKHTTLTPNVQRVVHGKDKPPKLRDIHPRESNVDKRGHETQKFGSKLNQSHRLYKDVSSVSQRDFVYFEDSSSPYILKTRLKYLDNDSRVYPKTSHASNAAQRREYKTRKLSRGPYQNNANSYQKYGIRHTKRNVAKLDLVEAKFMCTGHPYFSNDQVLPITAFYDSAEDTNPLSILSLSVSLPKVEFNQSAGTLDSKRRGSLISRKRHSLHDALAEKVIPRRVRGRGLSKPDLFRHSLTKESLQKDVDEIIARNREKKLSSLERFRHAARMIILMLRAVGLKPVRQEESNYNFLSWTVVYDEVLGISRLNYDSGALTFDPMLYKASKESTITQEVKDILRLPSNQRTDADVHTVVMCLQHVVPSFAEFPIRIQQSMVKVCTYEKFEAGRVIIRQGHRAENFYLILSGCAVVTEMESRANHVHTTNLLGKGNSFGELAFLNMSKRSATVTCRDVVELICIEREDFIDIFMRRIKGKEPEHIIFLKKVELLKGWPIKLLPHDNPKICAFTFVRRGVILCHDSDKSDWIIVVVSGSCKVLKALADSPVKRLTETRKPLHSHNIRLAQTSSNFPKIYTTTTASANKNARQQQLQQHQHQLQHKTGKSGTPVPEPSLRVTPISPLASRNETELHLSQVEHIAEINSIYYKKHVLPSIVAQRRRQEEPNDATVSAPTGHDPRQLPPVFRPKRQSYGLQPPALDLPQLVVTEPDATSELQKPLKSKVFIEITRLESGDVFGLEQVVFEGIRDVTSCSLVSEGAEVVLVSKKFFTRHLTEEITKRIRQLIRPLPSEKTLQKNLRTKKTWEAYKANTVARHSQGRERVTAFLKT